MTPDTAAGTPNISVDHQPEGAAAPPSDTLDRPAEQVHPARDFDPAADASRATPSGDSDSTEKPPHQGQ